VSYIIFDNSSTNLLDWTVVTNYFHQFLTIIHVFYFVLSVVQVSKVSDVVSVGQSLSLTCVGQDVRGNIKLSLKATLPPPRDKKKSENKDTNSLPSQGIIGWAAVENSPSVHADGEPSSSKHDDGTPEEGPAFSTPAVVIRSVDECDSHDAANSPTKKQRKVAKSSPRPYKSASGREEVRTAAPKKASSAKKIKKGKTDDSNKSDELETSAPMVPEQCASNAQDMKHSSPRNLRSGSVKLGDVVTAKVCQIRTYGLVLELSDGEHGMHKFQVTYTDSEESKQILLMFVMPL
jgi:polyribonucleotide nucleotidyltransferase